MRSLPITIVHSVTCITGSNGCTTPASYWGWWWGKHSISALEWHLILQQANEKSVSHAKMTTTTTKKNNNRGYFGNTIVLKMHRGKWWKKDTAVENKILVSMFSKSQA